MAGVALAIRGLGKVYRKGRHTLQVLDEVDLDIAPGDRVAIVGPSGSGKSTFLHLIGLLDRPSTGTIAMDGTLVTGLAESRRHKLRNRSVGFVFQAHNLLPGFSALENVMVPARLGGASRGVARERARILLGAVGLRERVRHKPGELSGGEQQRVALARALVMEPGLILADEPTGNLDPRTAGGVFDLMMQLNQQIGSTLVMVTHSEALAQRFPRRLGLRNSRFEEM